MSVIRSITRDLLGSLTRNIIVETIASAAAAILDSLQTESNGMVLHFESDTALVRDTGTPANDYDGSFNTEIADFLTYTSPSAKNVLQADGTLKYAAHNLYLNSGIPATQNITVVSGHPYKLIVTGTTSITVSGAGTGTATAGSPVTFSAGTTTATLTLNSGTGTAQFFKTPASETYLETTGSARYALPLEYDSAGDCLGVLIEPAATNYFTNSTMSNWDLFAKTTWTANQATGPDGLMSMGVIADDASSGSASVWYSEAVALGSAGTYTLSIFAKAKQLSFLKLNVSSFMGGGEGTTWFNISSGTIGTTDPDHTAAIEDFGNGVYRCSITFAVDAGDTTGIFFIGPAQSDNVQAVDIDGTSDIYVCFPQIELGSVPTSYIPTYGSTVTRAADDGIDLASSSFPSVATAGSVIIKHTPKVATAGVLVSLGSSSTEEIEMYSSTGSHLLVTDGGVVQADLDAGTNATADTEFLTGASWAANDFAASIDGGTVATDVSGTLPVIDTLSIGRDDAGANGYHGHLKYIKIVNYAETDAELQSDTTA